MKCVLIQVQPYCSRAATLMALPTSWVQTDEARPYSESFAHATASSASVKRVTETTGPNTSRWTISSVCRVPAISVGSKKKPPPARALPPVVISTCRLAAARSTNPATRVRCSAEISGPISTPASPCEPTFSERTASLKFGDQPVVNLRPGVQAAGRRAVLAGVVEAKGTYPGDDRIEIGIVEDDDRGLAAEFEMGALEIAGRQHRESSGPSTHRR